MDSRDDENSSNVPVYRSLPLDYAAGSLASADSGGYYDAEPVYRSLSVLPPQPAGALLGRGCEVDARDVPLYGCAPSFDVNVSFKDAKLVYAPASGSEEPVSVSGVVKAGAPTLPLPLELYPISPTHGFSTGDPADVVPRISARLSDCEVDFKYVARKMKWKCTAHNSQCMAVSFVIRIYDVTEEACLEADAPRLLVEASRRNGCAMQWHSLYECIFSGLTDYVDFDSAHTECVQRRQEAQSRLDVAVSQSVETLPVLHEAQKTAGMRFLADALTSKDCESKEASARCLAQLSARPHVAAALLPRVAEVAPLAAQGASEETRSLALATAANLLESDRGVWSKDVGEDPDHPMPSLAQHASVALAEYSTESTLPENAKVSSCTCTLESRERRRQAARLCSAFAKCWPSCDTWKCWGAVETLRSMRQGLELAAASDDERLRRRALDALGALPRPA